jgi:hypothetical protein
MLETVPSFEIIFTETKDLLLRQLDNVEAMDTKAGIVAGFDGAIVVASLAALKDFPELSKVVQPVLPDVFIGAIVAGYVMVLVSFVLALWSYRIASYKEVLEPRESLKKWIELPADETRIKLFHNLIGAYELNTKSLDRKARKLNLSLFALLLTVVSFAVAALTFLYAMPK